MSGRWPRRLWIVRHGQGAAHAAGGARIDIAGRDADVPLSRLGELQAAALGRWFAAMPATERPEVLLTSTYRRAIHTARIVVEQGGVAQDAKVGGPDERLREREFGVLDRLTRHGIESLFPDEAARRLSLGKFYHRPPGGESWCDVILRLRSALDTLSLHHADRRVLIVGHQVIVLCLRYLLEGLDEQQILAIDSEAEVANCGVTEYRQESDGLQLLRYNFVAPLEEQGAPVTSAPDAAVAAR
jgi:probable phosphoglycerate mutase